MGGLLGICLVADSFGMEGEQSLYQIINNQAGASLFIGQATPEVPQTPSSGLRGFMQAGFNSMAKNIVGVFIQLGGQDLYRRFIYQGDELLVAQEQTKQAKIQAEIQKDAIQADKDIAITQEQQKNAKHERAKELLQTKATIEIQVAQEKHKLEMPTYISEITEPKDIQTPHLVFNTTTHPEIIQLILDRTQNYRQNLRVILAGPPGNSKTVLPKLAAKMRNVPLATINASNFWQNSTDPSVLEKDLKQLLSKDCVVLVDEADLVLMDRDKVQKINNVDGRIIYMLRSVFNENENHKADVFFTTNKELYSFDPAITERFPDQYILQNPDSEMRERLIEFYRAKLIGENQNALELFDSEKIKTYSAKLDGASCRKIQTFMENVASSAKRNKGQLTESDIDAALIKIQNNINSSRKTGTQAGRG